MSGDCLIHGSEWCTCRKDEPRPYALINRIRKELAMPTRAKFSCTGASGGTQKQYSFSAVTDDGTPENQRYHKATPSGSLSLSVDNPAVEFEVGAEYYVDITPAE